MLAAIIFLYIFSLLFIQLQMVLLDYDCQYSFVHATVTTAIP